MASGVEKRASHYLILPPATVHPINLRYGNILGFIVNKVPILSVSTCKHYFADVFLQTNDMRIAPRKKRHYPCICLLSQEIYATLLDAQKCN